MKVLNKKQKGLVVFSLLYVIGAYLFVENEYSYIFEHLIVFCLPVILYWCGVWIWGFGYLIGLLKFIKHKFNKLIKFVFYLFCLVVLFLIAGFTYDFITIHEWEANCGSYTRYVWEKKKICQKGGNWLDALGQNYIRDLGSSYGIVYSYTVSFPKLCSDNGYELKFLPDKFREKYNKEIYVINEIFDKLPIDIKNRARDKCSKIFNEQIDILKKTFNVHSISEFCEAIDNGSDELLLVISEEEGKILTRTADVLRMKN